MATVSLKGITKSFGAVDVIKGVDLDVADGEFIVFVGPSGCGKSTLLRLIAGLEEITAGDLSIGGVRCNDLAPKQRGIAMVFQSYALYPHKSVYDNMAFGLQIARAPKAEVEAKVRDAARILQMEHLLERRPSQLSGGQRQRVAIGRAIVRDPQVFLFDEPLSNLDAALRASTRVEIARLHQRLKTTTIYVTHDQLEAMTLADRIVLLNGGRIEQAGTPQEMYERPGSKFVAGFIGTPKMNFIDMDASISGDRLRLTRGETQIETPAADFALNGVSKVTLGVRPTDLGFASQGGVNALRCTVDLVEYLGNEAQLNVRNGDDLLTAVVAARAVPSPGAEVTLAVPTDRVHLFDAATGRSLAR